MKHKNMAALLAVAMTLSLPCAGAEDTPTAVPEPASVVETQKPTAEPAKEPTAAPTATPAPTAEPTATPEPTAEPTATPAPTAEPTATPVPTAEPTATPVPTAESTATPAPTAEPTATPVPTAESTATPAPTAAPAPAEELQVEFNATVSYGYAGRKALTADLRVSGGDGEYSAKYAVYRDGRKICTMTAGDLSDGMDEFRYQPTHHGTHKVVVTVKDGTGASCKKSFKLPVAQKDRQGDAEWIELAEKVEITGVWAKDMLAVARSQVGYEESRIDFSIDDDGVKHGYTMYGKSGGGSYYNWCAAFVRWCIGYTDAPDGALKGSIRVREFKKSLTAKGVYVEDVENYLPKGGDLIFFNDEGEASAPHHIGIVDRVADGVVYTIEGNNGRAVRGMSYLMEDETIVGYADLLQLQLDWEAAHKPQESEPTELENALAGEIESAAEAFAEGLLSQAEKD